MKHYICTGECGGVSDKPGNCQAEACSKHDMPLTECNCTDDKHGHSPDSEDSSSDPANK